MKKSILVSLFAATMISVMVASGCGKQKEEQPSSEEVVAEVQEAADEVADDAEAAISEVSEDTQEALEDAADDAEDALEDAAEDAKEDAEDAADDAEDALEDAADDAKDSLDDASAAVQDSLDDASTAVQDSLGEALDGVADELGVDSEELAEEFEAIKENLVYMGGLYISDPNNDLMMCIFKNDGLPVAVVEKKGDLYYGEFTTEDATLEDGREYTKLLLEDKVFGYHFKLEDEDADSFMVDEDGTVYDAKDMDESVAYTMVMDTLK